MKNAVLFLSLLVYNCYLFAQVSENLIPNPKFGKPTTEELTMTSYVPDSSAVAVVLYKQTLVDYNWLSENFSITYSYKTRIKILKDEGTSYANVTIPFYEPKSNRTVKETISGLSAYAYNMENGKMVRTKMKREEVFEERLNDSYQQIKFSIPQVKIGTVIEYEYKILSDLYYHIRDWQAQDDIPVFYTVFEVTIPEYFKFNIDTHGMEHLETKQGRVNQSFTINAQLLQCNASHSTFIGHQLPAIKDDAYVWCPENYSAQVNLELQGYAFPGMLYKNFTQTWEEIEQLLSDDQDFGGRLKMSNPFKEEMAALHLEQIDNIAEKISAIYTLLKSKVIWNEKYALYGQSTRQILKDGTGSNADINFLFISMLKDAGIDAYPIVMSRRDQPMIPYSHPSLQKLSTFIVGIADTDSTLVYLDASVRDGYINVLPPLLMTNRARLLKPRQSQWINLQNIYKNFTRSTIQATISPDGKLTGKRMTSYSGQSTADLRKEFRTSKDSLDFIQRICNRENIEIKSYTATKLHSFSPTIQETMEFEKQVTINDSYIYVNPLVFLHISESPFKQSERRLPVEFAYPESLNIGINLTIPEGYVIDELPESNKIVTSDGKMSALYYIVQKGRQVNIRYTFSLSQLLYAPDSYSELKTFWEQLAKKNNAMMVLKKN